MGKTIQLNRWQLLLGGVIGFFFAYILGSIAFDTGSLLQYFGTLVLLMLSMRLIMSASKKSTQNN